MIRRLALAAAILVAVSLLLKSQSPKRPPDSATAESAAERPGRSGDETPEPLPTAEIRVVGVNNSAGRSGAFYVPSAASERALPLLVLLHPTGASGRTFLPGFLSLAESRGFAIVAPDSRVAPDGAATWEVGDRRGDVTPDLTHIMAVIAWVRTHEQLRVDESKVLIAGFSGGGSSAPYVATNRTPFTHAAVLHGRAFLGGLGSRRVRMWLSTGDQDEFAPQPDVASLADSLRQRRHDVTLRTYAAGHRLTDLEKEELIAWWLGR